MSVSQHRLGASALPGALPSALFIVIWSSAFIASRAGLAHLSPLAFVAIRQSIVAAVCLGLMMASRDSWVVLKGRWHHCAIAGVLINGVTLTTAHVGMVHVGAAPMSLMGALNPMLTAVLAVPLLGERLTARQGLGLALGLAGVGLVIGISAMQSRAEAYGLLLGGAGIVGLCGGTLYFGRFCRGVPLLAGATVQFAAAAVACDLAALLLEKPHLDWTPSAVAAMAWNVGVVSLGGMALYFHMLTRGATGIVAANFYLVPGTVAVLGWALLGERLSPLAVLGLAVASLGVWLVRRG